MSTNQGQRSGGDKHLYIIQSPARVKRLTVLGRLDKGGSVQSSLVLRTEYISVATLMDHNKRYFHRENRNYLIKRIKTH